MMRSKNGFKGRDSRPFSLKMINLVQKNNMSNLYHILYVQKGGMGIWLQIIHRINNIERFHT